MPADLSNLPGVRARVGDLLATGWRASGGMVVVLQRCEGDGPVSSRTVNRLADDEAAALAEVLTQLLAERG